MKRLILWLLLFIGLYSFTFAINTSVWVVCPIWWQVSLINWNNSNNLANTNSIWVCTFSSSPNAWYVKFMTYTWWLISQFWPINHWWAYNYAFHFLWGKFINFWNYTLYMVSSSNWWNYWSDIFYINKSTGFISVLDPFVWLTSNAWYVSWWWSTRSYWWGFTPFFTFDNSFLYIYNLSPRFPSAVKIDKLSGLVSIWLSTIPINSYRNYTSINYDVVNLDYDRVINRFLNNNNLLQWIYDNISNTVIETTINSFSTGSLVFRYDRWDLNEYFSSEGFTTYHWDFSSWWLINSFSGYLSYISWTWTNINLHNIPQSIWSLADYTRTNMLALVAWTWSNERFWYMVNWELFFNWDLVLLSNYVYNTNVIIDSWTWTWTIFVSSWTLFWVLYSSNVACNVPVTNSINYSVWWWSLLWFSFPIFHPFQNFDCLVSEIHYFMTPPTSSNILWIDVNNATYTPYIASPHYSWFWNYKFWDILVMILLVSILFSVFNYGLWTLDTLERVSSYWDKKILTKFRVKASSEKFEKKYWGK